jgi:hypothetical protein
MLGAGVKRVPDRSAKRATGFDKGSVDRPGSGVVMPIALQGALPWRRVNRLSINSFWSISLKRLMKSVYIQLAFVEQALVSR